jgi:hypothetical protein
MFFLVSNVSEELLPPSSHQKIDNRKFFCHAGDTLWCYRVSQHRRPQCGFIKFSKKLCSMFEQKLTFLYRNYIKPASNKVLYSVTFFIRRNHPITKQAINEPATNRLCHGSGSKLTTSHHRGPNSIPGQFA